MDAAMIVGAVAGAVFGAASGGYLTVLAARLPRGSEPGGRSRCPRCNTPIAGRDILPVLGYVLLRGRCRACATRIRAWYPAVEVGVAIAGAVTGAAIAPHPTLPLALTIAWLLALGVLWVGEAQRDPRARVRPAPLTLVRVTVPVGGTSLLTHGLVLLTAGRLGGYAAVTAAGLGLLAAGALWQQRRDRIAAPD